MRTTIKKIRVLGERNSGTNFLIHMFKRNLQSKVAVPLGTDDNDFWKHAFLDPHSIPDKDTTLFVFVIRDLHEWLASMYKSPYHLHKPFNIEDFITNPVKLNIKNMPLMHPLHQDLRERTGNLFEIRYNKIRHYIKFAMQTPYYIFVNLSFLQYSLECQIDFVQYIHDKFGLTFVSEYRKVEKHTKTSNKMHVVDPVTKKIMREIPNEIIEHYQNKSVETVFSQLKYTCSVTTLLNWLKHEKQKET